jgi:hypothetical protein
MPHSAEWIFFFKFNRISLQIWIYMQNRKILAHEWGDPGVQFNEKKPRVENLVRLSLLKAPIVKGMPFFGTMTLSQMTIPLMTVPPTTVPRSNHTLKHNGSKSTYSETPTLPLNIFKNSHVCVTNAYYSRGRDMIHISTPTWKSVKIPEK